ncbi:autotransporter-associated beta strand repeat-containing protein [Coraliomargarita algicola]|uniref:Autotransporter-associated beta strand repeat-containing protein n=1 Tax=Coraliomargarita algicola TaxID=3092156 RepID=A0ABZ0RFW2_9BACT|nr:autotransporter-associated beta strand repeat-containing protein [Coraliomargarita sp. J2-16]WPJ95055.1 autotransporter-associated beta strand repeat-containing protein [Coraliomargarita sp. J2-16]
MNQNLYPRLISRSLTRRATAPLNLAVLSTIFVFTASNVNAAGRSWANSGSDFNTDSNWGGGSVPTDADWVSFNGTPVYQPNLSASVETQSLTFNGAGYVVSSSSPSFTLSTGGITSSVAGTTTISAPVIFDKDTGNYGVNQATGGLLDLSGGVSTTDNARLVEINSGGQQGTVSFSGMNTYGGNTWVGAGTIEVSVLGNAGAAGNYGTGDILLGRSSSTGTLNYIGSGETSSKVIDMAGTVGGAKIDTTGATGALILTADIVHSNVNLKTLTLTGDTTGNALQGEVTDSAWNKVTSVVKDGSGEWTLSAANTYSGSTTVENGKLIAAHENALGETYSSGQGADVIVNGGELDSTVANVNIGGALTLAGGQLTTRGNDIGSYTLGNNENFSFTDGTLSVTLAAAGGASDQIIGGGTGTFTITGGILDLGDTVVDYAITYSIFAGFDSGSVSGLDIVGYDTDNWIAALNADGGSGVLSFSAIPEPMHSSAILAFLSLAAVSTRKRFNRHR